MAEGKEKQEFDDFALMYSEKIEARMSHVYSVALLNALGIEEGKSVLETGGGSGQSLKVIQNLKPKNCHYHLTDISPEMIKAGIKLLNNRSNDKKENAGDLNSPTFFSDLNISISIADGMKLPFKDSTFDIYMCNMTLHHTPDGKKVIEEAYRVLESGGRIGITEFGRKSETSFTYPFTLLKSYQKDFHDHKHSHAHSLGEDPSNLVKLLESSGFTKVKAWYFTTPVTVTSKDLYEIAAIRFPAILKELDESQNEDFKKKLDEFVKEKEEKHEIIKFDQVMAIGVKK